MKQLRKCLRNIAVFRISVRFDYLVPNIIIPLNFKKNL